jgi:hypothetical protein
VYRVYSEEEYLNDAGPDLATIGECSPAAVQPVSRGTGERRRHRVAGVAMLVGAVGMVGGVVAVNALRTHGTAVGAGHGSLLAATRSRVDTGSPRPLAARPSALARSRVAVAERGRDTSSAHPKAKPKPKPKANLAAALRVRRRVGGSRHVRPAIRPAGGGGVRRGAGTVIVVDDSPGSRSGPSTPAGGPAEGSGTTSPTVESAAAVSSADAATVHPGPGGGAEFGFEH